MLWIERELPNLILYFNLMKSFYGNCIRSTLETFMIALRRTVKNLFFLNKVELSKQAKGQS